MRRPRLRIVFCILVVIVFVPLALAQSSLRVPYKPIFAAAPSVPGGSASELLVGELGCFPDLFGGDTRVTFVAHGTIAVQTGGMGEVIGRLIASPEDPCPGFHESAAGAIQAHGCVAALAGNSTLTFVCHDRREQVLEVMAVVSRGVLTGTF